MIRHEKGECVVICDNCEERLPGSFYDFDDARKGAKDAGWKAVYDTVEQRWTNICPDCN